LERGAAFFGLEVHPLSRSDLSWEADNRVTGLAVGEFDGVVRPSVGAFFGDWLTRRIALQGSIGLARLQNTTWVGDVWEQTHWGVIRPELDARFALALPREHVPQPWILAGLYADIPSVRQSSNGFDEDEQALADEGATADFARLAGLGGRLGFGVDLRILPAFSLGALADVGIHRGLFVGDDPNVVSSWVSGEASLLATFWWDGKRGAPGADLDSPAE
jgi:hypothetical protein